MPVPMAHKGSPPEWEASWVNFVKKDFQWNACAKGTWRQSTSLRSLMSVNFAKKNKSMKCQCQWHIRAVHLNENPHEWILSKKIFSEMPVPRVHEGSPPHWEASWVWILQKKISEMPVPMEHKGSPPRWEASWVYFLKKRFSVKCQCQWHMKAVHLIEKPSHFQPFIPPEALIA